MAATPPTPPTLRPEPGPPTGAGAEALLRRLEWTALRRLDGLLQGDHATPWRGPGLDLADLREYQPPDDVRHIDWNATARLDQPHVRLFRADRDLAAWFALDLSPSMEVGSASTARLDVVRAFVGLLARVLTRHGNRVGALAWDQTPRAVLPPRAGRLQVLRLLQALGTPPAAPQSRNGGAPTALAQLIDAQAALARQRALVFVVSDFIAEDDWSAALGRLAQRHDVVAVRIADPIDQLWPDLGLVRVEDAETGEQILVDTRSRHFARRYAALAAEREARVREDLARSGVDALELSTHEPPEDAIVRFVALRRLRTRLARGAARGADLRAAGVAP